MNLSQARLKQLLKYDQETGYFIWLETRGRTAKQGNVAGSKDGNGYIKIVIDGKCQIAHRLAFLYITGKQPSCQVDHIDGNRINNKWENLRLATNAENQQNLPLRKDNKSGYIGVSWCSSDSAWRARITSNGTQIWLGNFSEPEDAYQAYLKAKADLHHFQPTPRVTGNKANSEWRPQ